MSRNRLFIDGPLIYCFGHATPLKWRRRAGEAGDRDMSRLIGVYGSLRKGGQNYPLLSASGAPAVPRAVVRIPGRLYSLGEFCCAVPLADGEDGEIVAEIYEVDDEIFRSLDAMEREVGYVGMETTAADAEGVERTFIVWYHPEAPANAVRVEDGDWVVFCGDRNHAY
jgi:gamma-glutamylcyclotransferase (GGCT)/AIG2-like uncharacterized protein YtfP